MDKLVFILMRRDGMSQEDAIDLIAATRDEIEETGYSDEATDIIEANLGLEPDYLMDVVFFADDIKN